MEHYKTAIKRYGDKFISGVISYSTFLDIMMDVIEGHKKEDDIILYLCNAEGSPEYIVDTLVGIL